VPSPKRDSLLTCIQSPALRNEREILLHQRWLARRPRGSDPTPQRFGQRRSALRADFTGTGLFHLSTPRLQHALQLWLLGLKLLWSSFPLPVCANFQYQIRSLLYPNFFRYNSCVSLFLLNLYYPPDTSSTAKMAQSIVVDSIAARHDVGVLCGRPKQGRRDAEYWDSYVYLLWSANSAAAVA
jgi:hypothetical protein